MPGGDGTGPLGYGSRTGRGLGACAPAQYTNAENNERPNERPIYGLGRRGLSRGRDRGSGFGGGRGPGFGGGRGQGFRAGREFDSRYEEQSQTQVSDQKLDLILKKMGELEEKVDEFSEK